MKADRKFSLTQKYHSTLWWVMVIFFIFLSLEQFLPTLLDGRLPLYGVLFIIFATVLRAVLLAVDFKQAGQKANFWLSLSLVALIGLAALAGKLI